MIFRNMNKNRISNRIDTFDAKSSKYPNSHTFFVSRKFDYLEAQEYFTVSLRLSVFDPIRSLSCTQLTFAAKIPGKTSLCKK